MADITLFGETRCPKTRFYQAALEERGLDYEMAEVDKDPDAARRLTDLAGSFRPSRLPVARCATQSCRNWTRNWPALGYMILAWSMMRPANGSSVTWPRWMPLSATTGKVTGW